MTNKRHGQNGRKKAAEFLRFEKNGVYSQYIQTTQLLTIKAIGKELQLTTSLKIHTISMVRAQNRFKPISSPLNYKI